MSDQEPTPKPFQVEIKKYGEVDPQLIELAKFGINAVLQEMSITPSKPLVLHITQGVFENQFGATFTEMYERLADEGNMYIAYDNGYREKYRQQIAERYGFDPNTPAKDLLLYSACHSTVHFVQDIHMRESNSEHTRPERFNPDNAEYVEKHLDDPLEKEAHEVGLRVMRKIVNHLT